MQFKWIKGLCIVACALLAHPLASAQASKPLHLVVITTAGGAVDTISRLLAQQLTAKLNRPVIVENKPGAGGNIAAQFVAKSAPDGDTLLVTSNNHTVNASLWANPGYRLEDFAPVINVGSGPTVIVVHPSAPQRSIQELINYAKSAPLAFGSPGVGYGAHLVGECLKALTGAKLEHIPYKGGSAAATDLLGNNVPLVFAAVTSTVPYVNAGRLRALAVSSLDRWPSLPEVPTLKEEGYGECSYDSWIGVFAPRNTPEGVLNPLNKQFAEILNDPQVREKIFSHGFVTKGGTRQDFSDFLAADYKLTSMLIRRANLQPQ